MDADKNADKKDRLEKMREKARFARVVHTNPVEVGIDDLEWMIMEIARLRYLLAVEMDGEECAGMDSVALDRTADGEVIEDGGVG